MCIKYFSWKTWDQQTTWKARCGCKGNVTCLVTVDGFWIDNWVYCTLIQLVTTVNYSAIANSHTLRLTMAHKKSSMSSLGVAWHRIPTMLSSSAFHGSGPLWLTPISRLTTTKRPVFSVTLLPTADAPLLPSSRPGRLATSYANLILSLQIADWLGLSRRSSYITSARTALKTPPPIIPPLLLADSLSSDGSRIVVCLHCRRLSMAVSLALLFCQTSCHNNIKVDIK
jgi:hypothetical protein